MDIPIEILIEEERKRKELEAESERPRLQLEIPLPEYEPEIKQEDSERGEFTFDISGDEPDEEESRRGVVIIEL
jgi:hypothetical protein